MSYLIYSPKTPKERIYELKSGTHTIGRELDNNIVITGEPGLSRYHAEITIVGEQAILQDRRSKNGTQVNNITVDRWELKDKDWIACGSANFQFVKVLARPRTPLPKREDWKSRIVKKLSPDRSQLSMQELLVEEKKADSILKLRQHDTHQRVVDKLKILLEVSKQLFSPEDPERLLSKILDLLFDLMNIDRAVILMVDESSGQLEPKAVKLRPGIDPEMEFYSDEIVNWVRNTGEALLTEDARLDRRLQSDSILVQGIHASMCAPLKPYQEAIGVLYVDNLSMLATYAEEDLEFLTALANQAAAAVYLFREIYKREQKLKQEVAQLRVQIDQAKKERDVAEVIGADYFKKLQERAKKLRNKD